eukprot:3300911-Rhodomonas_salina.1
MLVPGSGRGTTGHEAVCSRAGSFLPDVRYCHSVSGSSPASSLGPCYAMPGTETGFASRCAVRSQRMSQSTWGTELGYVAGARAHPTYSQHPTWGTEIAYAAGARGVLRQGVQRMCVEEETFAQRLSASQVLY